MSTMPLDSVGFSDGFLLTGGFFCGTLCGFVAGGKREKTCGPSYHVLPDIMFSGFQVVLRICSTRRDAFGGGVLSSCSECEPVDFVCLSFKTAKLDTTVVSKTVCRRIPHPSAFHLKQKFGWKLCCYCCWCCGNSVKLSFGNWRKQGVFVCC